MRAINVMISPYNFHRGDTSRIRYIVIHYTGGFGTAKDNCKYFAGGERKSSAHYFVGYEGEIWQSVEDKNIAWHCGAKAYKHPDCRNANSIGIELCVRKKDQNSKKAADEDWYFEDATMEAAAELTKYLMSKYGVPLDNVLRHYDVTGKICPAPFVHNTTAHTWEEFRKAVGENGGINWFEWLGKILAAIGRFLAGLMEKATSEKKKDTDQDMTLILGKPCVSIDRIAAYIISKNPSAAYCARQLAELYIEEGTYEGVRGDVAAAQAMLETGNLTFAGSEVTPDQNNFCGMGVTAKDRRGCSFKTMQEGVRAQIQHLKAYASEKPLVKKCVDPRYDYVNKGSARYVEWLGQQENPKGKGWSSGEGYGSKILKILEEMKKQREN